jgi:hypothetical protein
MNRQIMGSRQRSRLSQRKAARRRIQSSCGVASRRATAACANGSKREFTYLTSDCGASTHRFVSGSFEVPARRHGPWVNQERIEVRYGSEPWRVAASQ